MVLNRRYSSKAVVMFQGNERTTRSGVAPAVLKLLSRMDACVLSEFNPAQTATRPASQGAVCTRRGVSSKARKALKA